HAGWMGTVKKIAAEAVSAMQRAYGSRAADILAGIGPSIGADHYEIRGDVESQVRAAFDGQAGQLLANRHGGLYLDLWSANRLTLEACGVRQIEVAEICTACAVEDWYSHRGEAGRTGRFGALIALQEFEAASDC
ncbi:MAG TPA: laccase domain-containing protein, partial [Anaerolineaceae bacterium]|nr:laccase domain-containing protein [Anaerolineaceae bacterium]